MEYQGIADILKILGNDTRLSMIAILLLKNSNVGEFSEIFDISQPCISHHLRILKNADLITENRKGLWNVYSINSQNIYFPLVKDILSYFPSQEEKLDWLERQDCELFTINKNHI